MRIRIGLRISIIARIRIKTQSLKKESTCTC